MISFIHSTRRKLLYLVRVMLVISKWKHWCFDSCYWKLMSMIEEKKDKRTNVNSFPR